MDWGIISNIAAAVANITVAVATFRLASKTEESTIVTQKSLEEALNLNKMERFTAQLVKRNEIMRQYYPNFKTFQIEVTNYGGSPLIFSPDQALSISHDAFGSLILIAVPPQGVRVIGEWNVNSEIFGKEPLTVSTVNGTAVEVTGYKRNTH